MSLIRFENPPMYLTQEGPCLPKILWGYIFSYLKNYDDFSACARTCKYLWEVSLRTPLYKRFNLTMTGIKREIVLKSAVSVETKSSILNIKGADRFKIAALGLKEVHNCPRAEAWDIDLHKNEKGGVLVYERLYSANEVAMLDLEDCTADAKWFIAGEFFFLDNGVHVIHLPSKYECTELIQPLFKALKVAVNDIKFLSIASCNDYQVVFDVVVQKEEMFEWLQATCLTSLLQTAALFNTPQSTIELVSEEKADTTWFQSDNIIKSEDLLPKFKGNNDWVRKRRQRTEDKVFIVLSIILPIIMAIACAILVPLHPGKVLYVGSGGILTLPTVITLAVGCSVQILLSIAYYRLYKSRHVQ